MSRKTRPASRILAASILALALFAACTGAAASPPAPAIDGAPVVAVTTTEMKFTPAEIRLPSKEVNLTVENEGSTRHDLTIAELGIKLVVEPGQSVTTGLRDLPKGTYDYVCSVFGHKDAGMQGKVVVE